MRKSARKAGPDAPLGSRVYDVTEARSDFLLEYKAGHPMAGYGEMLAACRKQYSCSQGSAERAMKRFRERMSEVRENKDGQTYETIQSVFGYVITKAKEAGNLTEMRKTAEAMAKLGDMYKPQEIVIHRPDGEAENYEDLSDEQLEAIAALKKKRTSPTEH